MGGAVAGEHELAVQRDIKIMHGPFGTDALDFGERRGIDNIRDARVIPHRSLSDSHVDFFPIRRNRDVVGTARERDLLDDLQRLDIRHVQRPVGLIADVDPGCVGGRRDAMGRLDAWDLSHDLVRDRVNQVYSVPGGVALEDPNLALSCQRQREHKDRQRPQAASNHVNSSHRQLLEKRQRLPSYRDRPTVDQLTLPRRSSRSIP